MLFIQRKMEREELLFLELIEIVIDSYLACALVFGKNDSQILLTLIFDLDGLSGNSCSIKEGIGDLQVAERYEKLGMNCKIHLKAGTNAARKQRLSVFRNNCRAGKHRHKTAWTCGYSNGMGRFRHRIFHRPFLSHVPKPYQR